MKLSLHDWLNLRLLNTTKSGTIVDVKKSDKQIIFHSKLYQMHNQYKV